MTDIVTTSWSELDASNSQFPPEGWPSGMFPNAVEPTARMNMGALKRFWNRVNPVYAASTSTADSYTFAPTQAITGYGLYERLTLRMPQANASTSPTLLASSLPPQPIKKYVASSVTTLAAGDIRAKDHEFYWDGLQFILMNPFAAAVAAGVTSVDVANQTSGGLLFSGGPITGAGAIGGKFNPSNLAVKSSLTSSDTVVIGDSAAAYQGKTALISLLLALVPSSGFSSIVPQAFVASGTYTPTANMKYCIAVATGAGGGGGGSAATGAGGGGGAGGTAIGVFSAATIGASQTVTINNAGAGGVAAGPTAGGNGGTTTLGALLTGGGGTGAPGINNGEVPGAGGAGGTASGGIFNIPGGAGSPGGTAGTAINGTGGQGGGPLWGTGGPGGISGAATGLTATVYGAGGGGPAGSGTGGAGLKGAVLVFDFI